MRIYVSHTQWAAEEEVMYWLWKDPAFRAVVVADEKTKTRLITSHDTLSYPPFGGPVIETLDSFRVGRFENPRTVAVLDVEQLLKNLIGEVSFTTTKKLTVITGEGLREGA